MRCLLAADSVFWCGVGGLAVFGQDHWQPCRRPAAPGSTPRGDVPSARGGWGRPRNQAARFPCLKCWWARVMRRCRSRASSASGAAAWQQQTGLQSAAHQFPGHRKQPVPPPIHVPGPCRVPRGQDRQLDPADKVHREHRQVGPRLIDGIGDVGQLAKTRVLQGLDPSISVKWDSWPESRRSGFGRPFWRGTV